MIDKRFEFPQFDGRFTINSDGQSRNKLEIEKKDTIGMSDAEIEAEFNQIKNNVVNGSISIEAALEQLRDLEERGCKSFNIKEENGVITFEFNGKSYTIKQVKTQAEGMGVTQDSVSDSDKLGNFKNLAVTIGNFVSLGILKQVKSASEAEIKLEVQGGYLYYAIDHDKAIEYFGEDVSSFEDMWQIIKDNGEEYDLATSLKILELFDINQKFKQCVIGPVNDTDPDTGEAHYYFMLNFDKIDELFPGQNITSLNDLIAAAGLAKDPVLNGEIGNYTQGYTGDCWLLVGLTSLSSSSKGREVIKKAIHVDNENRMAYVTFQGVHDKNGNPITIELSFDELKAFNTDSLYYDYFSDGDDDVLLMEMATNELIKLIVAGETDYVHQNEDGADFEMDEESGLYIEGGFPENMIFFLTGLRTSTDYSGFEGANPTDAAGKPINSDGFLTGIDSDTITNLLNSATEGSVFSFGLYSDVDSVEESPEGSGEYYTVRRFTDVDGNEHELKLPIYYETNDKGQPVDKDGNVTSNPNEFVYTSVSGHALAFSVNKNSNPPTVTIVNPWNSSEKIVVDWDTFIDLGIGEIESLDISNYKVPENPFEASSDVVIQREAEKIISAPSVQTGTTQSSETTLPKTFSDIANSPNSDFRTLYAKILAAIKDAGGNTNNLSISVQINEENGTITVSVSYNDIDDSANFSVTLNNDTNNIAQIIASGHGNNLDGHEFKDILSEVAPYDMEEAYNALLSAKSGDLDALLSLEMFGISVDYAVQKGDSYEVDIKINGKKSTIKLNNISKESLESKGLIQTESPSVTNKALYDIIDQFTSGKLTFDELAKALKEFGVKNLLSNHTKFEGSGNSQVYVINIEVDGVKYEFRCNIKGANDTKTDNLNDKGITYNTLTYEDILTQARRNGFELDDTILKTYFTIVASEDGKATKYVLNKSALMSKGASTIAELFKVLKDNGALESRRTEKIHYIMKDFASRLISFDELAKFLNKEFGITNLLSNHTKIQDNMYIINITVDGVTYEFSCPKTTNNPVLDTITAKEYEALSADEKLLWTVSVREGGNAIYYTRKDLSSEQIAYLNFLKEIDISKVEGYTLADGKTSPDVVKDRKTYRESLKELLEPIIAKLQEKVEEKGLVWADVYKEVFEAVVKQRNSLKTVNQAVDKFLQLILDKLNVNASTNPTATNIDKDDFIKDFISDIDPKKVLEDNKDAVGDTELVAKYTGVFSDVGDVEDEIEGTLRKFHDILKEKLGDNFDETTFENYLKTIVDKYKLTTKSVKVKQVVDDFLALFANNMKAELDANQAVINDIGNMVKSKLETGEDLKGALEFLKQYPEAKVTVTQTTDKDGNKKYSIKITYGSNEWGPFEVDNNETNTKLLHDFGVEFSTGNANLDKFYKAANTDKTPYETFAEFANAIKGLEDSITITRGNSHPVILTVKYKDADGNEYTISVYLKDSNENIAATEKDAIEKYFNAVQFGLDNINGYKDNEKVTSDKLNAPDYDNVKAKFKQKIWELIKNAKNNAVIKTMLSQFENQWGYAIDENKLKEIINQLLDNYNVSKFRTISGTYYEFSTQDVFDALIKELKNYVDKNNPSTKPYTENDLTKEGIPTDLINDEELFIKDGTNYKMNIVGIQKRYSDYIGATGIIIDTPEKLAKAIRWSYNLTDKTENVKTAQNVVQNSNTQIKLTFKVDSNGKVVFVKDNDAIFRASTDYTKQGIFDKLKNELKSKFKDDIKVIFGSSNDTTIDKLFNLALLMVLQGESQLYTDVSASVIMNKVIDMFFKLLQNAKDNDTTREYILNYPNNSILAGMDPTKTTNSLYQLYNIKSTPGDDDWVDIFSTKTESHNIDKEPWQVNITHISGDRDQNDYKVLNDAIDKLFDKYLNKLYPTLSISQITDLFNKAIGTTIGTLNTARPYDGTGTGGVYGHGNYYANDSALNDSFNGDYVSVQAFLLQLAFEMETLVNEEILVNIAQTTGGTTGSGNTDGGTTGGTTGDGSGSSSGSGGTQSSTGGTTGAGQTTPPDYSNVDPVLANLFTSIDSYPYANTIVSTEDEARAIIEEQCRLLDFMYNDDRGNFESILDSFLQEEFINYGIIKQSELLKQFILYVQEDYYEDYRLAMGIDT